MARDNSAFQISEGTKKLTTKCPFDFECMSNHNWETCSISRKLQNVILCIENKCNKSKTKRKDKLKTIKDFHPETVAMNFN